MDDRAHDGLVHAEFARRGGDFALRGAAEEIFAARRLAGAAGGRSRRAGGLAGGLLLGVVEALGMHFSSPSLKMLLSYAVFIGVLIWRPNGLFSKK